MYNEHTLYVYHSILKQGQRKAWRIPSPKNFTQ
jgi:hypothetical protein